MMITFVAAMTDGPGRHCRGSHCFSPLCSASAACLACHWVEVERRLVAQAKHVRRGHQDAPDARGVEAAADAASRPVQYDGRSGRCSASRSHNRDFLSFAGDDRHIPLYGLR